MAFKDMFKKKYTASCYCNNCETYQDVEIPQGVTIIQFIEGNTGKCNNCKCNTLIAGYRQIDEFRNTKEEQRKSLPQVKVLHNPLKRREVSTEPLQRAQIPRPRPSNRPANSLPPKRPAPPEEPDFTPKGIYRSDVDFWTGNPKRRERRDEQNSNNKQNGSDDGYENY